MTYRQAATCFWIVFAPLIVLYVALAIPIFGFLVFDHLTHDALMGCERTTEGLLKSCQINGVDAGKVSGSYIASTFLLGIGNPMIAFMAIPVVVPRYILLPWVVLTFFLWLNARRLKRDA